MKVIKQIDQSKSEFTTTFQELLSDYLGQFSSLHQLFKKGLQTLRKSNEINIGKPQL